MFRGVVVGTLSTLTLCESLGGVYQALTSTHHLLGRVLDVSGLFLVWTFSLLIVRFHTICCHWYDVTPGVFIGSLLGPCRI